MRARIALMSMLWIVMAAAPAAGKSGDSEMVLLPGAYVSADDHGAVIEVEALPDLVRRVSFGRCVFDRQLVRRRQRWLGSLGAYDPAADLDIIRFGRSKESSCESLSRVVIDEGQLHFSNENTLNVWLSNYIERAQSVAWSANGLLISWSLQPARKQLNVTIYKLCSLGGAGSAATYTGAKELLAIDMRPPDGSKLERCFEVGSGTADQTLAEWKTFWAKSAP